MVRLRQPGKICTDCAVPFGVILSATGKAFGDVTSLTVTGAEQLHEMKWNAVQKGSSFPWQGTVQPAQTNEQLCHHACRAQAVISIGSNNSSCQVGMMQPHRLCAGCSPTAGCIQCSNTSSTAGSSAAAVVAEA
jgi:hypothetical protein